MRLERSIVWLAWITVLLTVVMAGMGLFWQDDGGRFETTNVRGQTVEIYGQGLYKSDSLFSAAGFRGTDLVTLAAAVPLLIYAILSYQRGSLRGGLLLAAALSYCLYYAASMAFGAFYNILLLVYTAALGVSLNAFILTVLAVDRQTLTRRIAETMPRKAIGWFLIASGVIVAMVWLSGIIPSLLSGEAPDVAGHYTTIITYPLDLGLIAPYAVIVGVLVLRRAPIGFIFAAPMLVLCALIGLVVAAQTAFQLNAGVQLTTGEVVIYVVSFLSMSLVAGWLSLAFFRGIADSTEPIKYTKPSLQRSHR